MHGCFRRLHSLHEVIMKEKKARQEFYPQYFPIALIVFISPYVIGLYYEWTAALVSVFLLCYLCCCKIRTGKILVPKTLTMLACVFVTVFFAVSPLWAVDKGMALMGFIKFLPLPLFSVAASQLSPEHKQSVLDTVPLSGAVMTVLSAVLCLVPVLRTYLLVNGRLGGFFQYPNTFAIFLLAGVFIQLYNKKFDLRTGIICGILIIGIFASGSRTVFLFMLVSAAVYIIASKNKKQKIFLAGAVGVLAAGTAAYALITGNLETVGRYLTSSFTSSTLIGRLLYYLDAAPVILTHPMGLGYMGYYFAQGSFQNGVYSVMNIHNDFLQILLDIGWIPAAICAAAFVSAIRKSSAVCRYVIILLVLHSMLDFDLQFLAVDLILIIAAECNNDKYIEIKNNSAPLTASVISAGLSIYLGAANMLYYTGRADLSAQMYPMYTTAYIQQISESDNIYEAEELADKILSLNSDVSIAYSAKARAEFSRGDVLKMTEYKKKAIELSKYTVEEYKDYCYMLETAAGLYENGGDDASAQYCLYCIEEAKRMLADLKDTTSPLAFMINDKPQFTIE